MDFVEPETERFEELISSCSVSGGVVLEPFAQASSGGHGECCIAAVTSRAGDESERMALIDEESLYIVSNTIFEGVGAALLV